VENLICLFPYKLDTRAYIKKKKITLQCRIIAPNSIKSFLWYRKLSTTNLKSSSKSTEHKLSSCTHHEPKRKSRSSPTWTSHLSSTHLILARIKTLVSSCIQFPIPMWLLFDGKGASILHLILPLKWFFPFNYG
jgi:hypothetical protein